MDNRKKWHKSRISILYKYVIKERKVARQSLWCDVFVSVIKLDEMLFTEGQIVGHTRRRAIFEGVNQEQSLPTTNSQMWWLNL